MNSNFKIYYIAPIYNLESIIKTGYIFSYSIMKSFNMYSNTNIGLNNIKERRLNNCFDSYPDLKVGQCVPFYYCYRSVMLFLIYKKNDSLSFKDGQEFIVHFEFNMFKVIEWAKRNNKRWVITDSNAGSYYFKDSNKINFLKELNWDAITSLDWGGKDKIIHEKQAEFLVEEKVDFNLVERIGVFNIEMLKKVKKIVNKNIKVEIHTDWYY